MEEVARGWLGGMNTGWGEVFTFPCMRILMVREGGSAEVFIRFAMVRRSVVVSGVAGQQSDSSEQTTGQTRPGQTN